MTFISYYFHSKKTRKLLFIFGKLQVSFLLLGHFSLTHLPTVQSAAVYCFYQRIDFQTDFRRYLIILISHTCRITCPLVNCKYSNLRCILEYNSSEHDDGTCIFCTERKSLQKLKVADLDIIMCPQQLISNLWIIIIYNKSETYKFGICQTQAF